MWQDYYGVSEVGEALRILSEHRDRARIVAGATDLLLELERGVRKGIDTLIDVSRVPGLDTISLDEDQVVHLGPMVTHNACAASKLIVERAYPLAQAAWQVGAPQIRNRGTVAGNLVTASPANDTISPLMALDASIRLASTRGKRTVPLSEFYTGVRTTVMQPDEMLVDISFPAMKSSQRGCFVKLGLRRAQAISVVNAAILATFEEPGELSRSDGLAKPLDPLTTRVLENISITLGSVAPTIIHAWEAESYLVGRELSEAAIAHAAELAMHEARPIDDVRSSAAYRSEIVRICVLRGLRLIWKNEERIGFPDHPALLWGRGTPEHASSWRASQLHSRNSPIHTHINGKEYVFPGGHDRTLLRLLREDAGLTGTKEGCAEGECGACTVFLDGKAVMSCLVPAARAHGADIVTVEGLAQEGELHPVQQAFVEEGAVQCGYCTPGFLMSAAKLLEERPHPSEEEIKQALTGNLCRCTGYYKIVKAVERACSLVEGDGD